MEFKEVQFGIYIFIDLPFFILYVCMYIQVLIISEKFSISIIIVGKSAIMKLKYGNFSSNLKRIKKVQTLERRSICNIFESEIIQF